jgi:hypothetical protein
MRLLVVAVTLCLIGSCSTTSDGGGRIGSTTTPHPTITARSAATPTSTADSEESVFLPDPNRALPQRPMRIATELVKVTGVLNLSIKDWRRHGDINARPPKAVVWQSLYQQRLFRLMVRRESLGDRALRLLEGRIRRFSRANIVAGRALRSLVTPVAPDTPFRVGRPETAGRLLGYYRTAQRRFGIKWEVLAAVNAVETRFGRVRSSSTSGAQGPMQFIPSTWETYGMGGDINDPHDAIMGAANYLRASGAPEDYPRALYAYNHASAYVKAILEHTDQMERRTNNYFVYYNWQVFVITTSGDKRLTGPDLGG